MNLSIEMYRMKMSSLKICNTMMYQLRITLLTTLIVPPTGKLQSQLHYLEKGTRYEKKNYKGEECTRYGQKYVLYLQITFRSHEKYFLYPITSNKMPYITCKNEAL